MGATSVILVCYAATMYKQFKQYPKLIEKIDGTQDFNWSSHYPLLK
jgi:hypothetical protein